MTSLISRWNREWSCIWLPRRRVDPTRRRVLSLSSARSSCKDRELGAWSSSGLEWLMNDDGEVEALRSLVSLPWATQRHFVGMLQARRKDQDQVEVYFLFESVAPVLPLRTAWIADILFKRPCAMYKDNTVGNVVHVAETGRVFGTTVEHDWAIFQCRWQARFDARLNRLQGHWRRPIARSGKFVRRAYSWRALDCAHAFSHRARCTKTTLLETW